MILAVIGLVVLAVALFVFGFWGRRHVAELLPSTLSAQGRELKLRQYRRGAIACQVVAVLALVLAAAKFFGLAP